MKLFSRILLIGIFFSSFPNGFSQTPAHPYASNLRIKKLPVSNEAIVVDSFSIVPGTFTITGIESNQYALDFAKALFTWKSFPNADSVVVQYRVFPFKLNGVTQRMRFDSIASHFSAKPFQFNNNDTPHSFFEQGNVQYSGSFGRALSVGNRQNAVVNSNFQLQLSGMLKDSIEISAALTDNNIPIQPDGTTQQLNEFDQVFLQFKKKNWQLDLGDIDIRQKELYFLNFYKRLQGISFQNVSRLSASSEAATMVSGSIAKGKFTRNVFQGLEGNQGPYRLTGANNEFFFIVLANTERVFIDGELLQRGEDRDYVINYNTAEITFMPRRMITKDSRIQVEFEYADRNYLNANLFLSQQFSISDKLKVNLSTYSNSDAKNSQINQTLDNRQKQFLFHIGDSINQAFYPTALVDTFSAGKILYEKVYLSTAGTIDSFYRYSTDPAVALYNLSFTDVGDGRGNYISDFNGANGKVYRYVEPVNGMKQGRFEPVMMLVTPKKQQLIALGTEYHVSKHTIVSTEVAVSHFDQNTFSPHHSADQQGMAGKLQLTNTLPVNKKSGLHLISSLHMEHVQQSFKPIERLRMVEFAREWGLPILFGPATENIIRYSAQLRNQQSSGVTYQFTSYQRSDHYKGYQNMLRQTGKLAGWQMQNEVALTSFKTHQDKGAFFRPVIDISKTWPRLSGMQMGFRYTMEHNEVRNVISDSISPLSFSFDTYTAYLRTNESKKNRYAVNFFTRSDKHPYANALAKANRSYNINVQAALLSNEKHQLLFNSTYRVLQIYNKAISPQANDQTLLGRSEYIINEWKGLVRGNALYELGTGQEQRRDFVYLEVPAGQGEFTWMDNNHDGIQQINEFEVAIFRDQAKYIRIFTPTNQFSKANYNTFNYSIHINPSAVLNATDAGTLGKMISRLYLQSSLQKTRKALANDRFEFNPFKYAAADTALLTSQTSLINTFSFNRYSTRWGVDVTHLRNEGKALLTYGFETRLLQDWLLKWRWNINSVLTVDINTKKGSTALFTPAMTNRNYHINTWSAEPKLTFIKGTNFRLQGSYKVEEKQNALEYGGEHARSHIVGVETKYNVLQSSSLQGRFSYQYIDFRKADPTKANPNVAYIIMDALRPGANYLWSLDLTRRLVNNVEINFQYEGRRPADMQTIHTGRAAIRALF